MAGGYNTSVNQSRNNSYNYSPNTMPNTSVTGGNSTFNYSEVYNSAEPETSANKTKNSNPKSSAVGVWGITMGQTQNFTFAIKGICSADNAFNLKNRNGAFLPLKSFDYKPVALEHLKIKAGVFSDMPFFHRRRMGTISCSMLDSSKSLLSMKMFQWYNSCVHTAGWVPYIDDIAKEAEYIEYTHDGKIAASYSFYVIPEGDISVSRSYEGDGALTEYRFQLIIISELKAGGNGGRWVEADWGEGDDDPADYERRVYGTVHNFDNKGTNGFIDDPSIADAMGLNIKYN